MKRNVLRVRLGSLGKCRAVTSCCLVSPRAPSASIAKIAEYPRGENAIFLLSSM